MASMKSLNARNRTKSRIDRGLSTALPITDKQWSYLRRITGATTQAQLWRYVEFANGFYSGCEPYGGWSRIHGIEAINLALKGWNHHGTTLSLLCRSWTP